MKNNKISFGKVEYFNMLSEIDDSANKAANISLVNPNFKSLSFFERIANSYKYDRSEVRLPSELCGDDLSEDMETLLKAAVLMDLLGLSDTGRKLKKYIHKVNLIKGFETKVFDFLANEEARKIVSDSQSEKAKKPRSQHYLEVMEVIRLTWEKYPKAPKTGLLDALAAHYHKKVSRNTLYKWVNDSNLCPPKPKKHTEFELVFPQ